MKCEGRENIFQQKNLILSTYKVIHSVDKNLQYNAKSNDIKG